MRIAVVGGGATGALVATHIARRFAGRGAEICVIDPAENIGRGLAYSTTDPRHLLNVRVANMSAFADAPDHFRAWLERRDGAPVSPYSFVSRSEYGDYIAEIAREAISSGAIRHLSDTVVDIVESQSQATLYLASGRTLDADYIVLATGHDAKPAVDGLAAEPPWTANALEGFDAQAPVLIVGSGLTMVDLALSLDRRGHRGPIVVVSRRGLLSQAHRSVTPPRKVAAAEVPFGANLSGLLHWMRALARRFEADGADWRAAIDVLRPHTQRLWQAMTPAQKRRFLRHARVYWDIHRHRMAPEIAAALGALRASGRLRIVAGRIVSAEPCGEGVRVFISERGGEAAKAQTFARILDCTGLASDVTKSPNPLIRALLARGALRPDALQICLDVAEDFSIVDSDGTRSRRIKTLGPLARAAFWECIAIPDIRVQCREIADKLAAHMEQGISNAAPDSDGFVGPL